MRTIVIGDIHGGFLALKQVLERSGFDYRNDKLICLGDTCDGWGQTPECFDELLKIDSLVYIMGNHDYWLYEYLKLQKQERLWLHQGGQATLDAYKRVNDPAMNERHLKFLESVPYYIEEDGNLFVHGGFLTAFPIKNQAPYDLMWDRELWWAAKHYEANEDKPVAPGYKQVFIGHTSTSHERSDLTPIKASNVWNLDQGAGWEGKLTCMDVNTNEYWQSDVVKELYPRVQGR